MPDQRLIDGLHHVTALAGDPRKNLEFYAGVLGLRLVKKTVNFDAPQVYHFYFGDTKGTPGSLLTFFPYGTHLHRGRIGSGMATAVSFSAPASSRPTWEERLARFGVPGRPATPRFPGEVSLAFADPDGLGLEIVFTDKDTRAGPDHGPLPAEHSLRGLYGVEISVDAPEDTARFLVDLLDHRPLSEQGRRSRYGANDAPGSYVDLVVGRGDGSGRQGAGSIHHVAFSTTDLGTQAKARERLLGTARPTPPVDRQYFMSVYFHEPGGVLFEIATAGPGFGVDEPWESLGQSLKLPPQYERARASIEESLVPLSLASEAFR